MDPILVKFRNKLVLYFLIIVGIGTLIGYLTAYDFVFKWFWALSLLFASTSWVIYLVLFNVSREQPKKFIPWFMGLTGLKMFLFLMILLGFVLLNRDSAIPFILCFFAGYLLFSIFEVIHLLNMPLGEKNTSDASK